MIYYTNEARKSAIENISRLIVKIGEIPGNILNYSDVTMVNLYLARLKEEIEKEMKKEGN